MAPIIKSKAIQADVQIAREHDVRIQSRAFVLASASAIGLANGEIPEWLDASINAAIASGTEDLNVVIGQLDAYVRGLDEGVQQQINSLVSEDENINSLITTNVSRIDNNVAGAITLAETKVTAEEASTITSDILTSQFNTPGSDANAWFTSSTSTITTDIGANATSVTALIADYNNLNAQLIATSYVDVSGDQWEVGASKLAIGPNGALTGWEFNDGSALVSNFTISADQFFIESASVPGYKPFTVDGTNVSFDGIVNFTATNVAGGFPGTTTINGGLIETNTVDAAKVKATTIWTDGRIQSSDFVAWTAGFRLKADAAATSADPTIFGAYIKGCTMETSTMLLRDLIVLTDSGYQTKMAINLAMGANWGFYPSNSTSGTGKRAAQSSGNVIQCMGPDTSSAFAVTLTFPGVIMDEFTAVTATHRARILVNGITVASGNLVADFLSSTKRITLLGIQIVSGVVNGDDRVVYTDHVITLGTLSGSGLVSVQFDYGAGYYNVAPIHGILYNA